MIHDFQSGAVLKNRPTLPAAKESTDAYQEELAKAINPLIDELSEVVLNFDSSKLEPIEISCDDYVRDDFDIMSAHQMAALWDQ